MIVSFCSVKLFRSSANSSLRVETYFIARDGVPKVVLNYKCINYVASINDSVAGGVIIEINEKEINLSSP